MKDEFKPASKPLPTLLSKSDAMLYAAKQLEDQCSNMELLNILATALKKPLETTDDQAKEVMADLRIAMTGIVDIDLQKAAMREAAAEIRQMANESKLIEARAASKGISATA